MGRKLLGLIALALDLNEHFFEQVGALNDPSAVIRLLRYPGIYVTWNSGWIGINVDDNLVNIRS